MNVSLQQYLAEKRAQTEKALRTYLPPKDAHPALLHEAMHYSIFAGGKRLRPILLLMAAEMCEKTPESLLFAAAALEMVHTYSLIHDDLPAMDNDDLRRGQPTTHKRYGEAAAILAGDALLTLAFQTMSHADCPSAHLVQATRELSLAAGSVGMVGGQMLDIMAEQHAISAEALQEIHLLKTGKLIVAALRIGALLSGASPEVLNALSHYGERIGLAFQIVDDILDIEGNEAVLGKSAHSDIANQKSTYPTMFGLDKSKLLAQKLIREARDALRIFGKKARYLHELADYIISRSH